MLKERETLRPEGFQQEEQKASLHDKCLRGSKSGNGNFFLSFFTDPDRRPPRTCCKSQL